jgi:hypothetical protein
MEIACRAQTRRISGHDDLTSSADSLVTGDNQTDASGHPASKICNANDQNRPDQNPQ